MCQLVGRVGGGWGRLLGMVFNAESRFRDIFF